MKSRSVSYFLHWLLFKTVGRHLPASLSPGGKLWRWIRYWICRPLFASCGQNVNIERGAVIQSPWTVSIGSNSSIGINAFVPIGTQIGANVMMGPDVLIFARNHCTSRLDIPMNRQGFTENSSVVIGDDVWICTRVIILPGVTIGSGSVLGGHSGRSRCPSELGGRRKPWARGPSPNCALLDILLKSGTGCLDCGLAMVM